MNRLSSLRFSTFLPDFGRSQTGGFRRWLTTFAHLLRSSTGSGNLAAAGAVTAAATLGVLMFQDINQNTGEVAGAALNNRISCVAGNCSGLPRLNTNSGVVLSASATFGEVDQNNDGTIDGAWIDVEGDGQADVYAGYGANVQARDSNGNGIADTLVLDVDGDGLQEMVSASVDKLINGGLANQIDYGSVTHLDFDGDGTIDLTLADTDGDGQPVTLQAGGFDALLASDTFEVTFEAFEFVDSDGDNFADSVLIDSNGDGTADLSESPDKFSTIDIDQDGIADMVTYEGSENGSAMWKSYADLQTFLNSGDQPSQLYFESVEGIDLNGDGVADKIAIDIDGNGSADLVEAADSELVTFVDLDGNPATTEAIQFNGEGHALSGKMLYRDVAAYLANAEDAQYVTFDAFDQIDLDGDGVPDLAGLRGEGSSNPEVVQTLGDALIFIDQDGDSIPDSVSLDTNADGVSDMQYFRDLAAYIGGAASAQLSNRNTTLVDSDGDNQPDILGIDTNGDGVSDLVQQLANGYASIDAQLRDAGAPSNLITDLRDLSLVDAVTNNDPLLTRFVENIRLAGSSGSGFLNNSSTATIPGRFTTLPSNIAQQLAAMFSDQSPILPAPPPGYVSASETGASGTSAIFPAPGADRPGGAVPLPQPVGASPSFDAVERPTIQISEPAKQQPVAPPPPAADVPPGPIPLPEPVDPVPVLPSAPVSGPSVDTTQKPAPETAVEVQKPAPSDPTTNPDGVEAQANPQNPPDSAEKKPDDERYETHPVQPND